MENKIAIATLAKKGTGPNGRVVEADIYAEIERLKELAVEPVAKKEEPKKAA